jgi:hypothetical protein
MNPWEREWATPTAAPWERTWDAPAETDPFLRPPAQDMNTLQSMIVGTGRMFNKADAGIRQPLYALGAALDIPEAQAKSAELTADQAEQRRLYGPLQKEHPLATGIGESLPFFAVPVGGAATTVGTMGRMAVPGILQGLLSYGDIGERAKEAGELGVAGGVGGAVVRALGKVISPAVGAAWRAVNPEIDRLAGIAKSYGIDLTPAQAGGGKFWQGLESAFDTIPYTVGKQAAIKDTQQVSFNKALLDKLGVSAERATPDVLSDAATQIGARLDAGTVGIPVPITANIVAQVDNIERNFLKRLTDVGKVKVSNIVDDIKNAGPVIDGAQYKLWTEDLAAAARASGDTKTSNALYGLRKLLDDAYKASAPADKQALYMEGRQQYKTLLTIQDALEKSRNVVGDIPAKPFYASVQQFNANVPRGGGGEVADIARAGRQFLTDPINNSGTPIRTAFTNLLTSGGLGGLGASGAAMTGQDPMQGFAMGVAAPYMLSKGAQSLYHSGYLTNEALSEATKRLLMKWGALGGTGAAGGLLGSP